MSLKHESLNHVLEQLVHDSESSTSAGLTEETVATEASLVPRDHSEIEKLAYQYWLRRECPDGSPELDWLMAESELANAPAEKINSENHAL